MNLKDKATRARDKNHTAKVSEMPETYNVAKDDPELVEMTQRDLEAVQARIKALTSKGRLLLNDAQMCAVKAVGSAYEVTPFTRWALGLQVGRKGGLLNPYDLKLLKALVDSKLLLEYREPLPAKEMVGVAGDDLTVGAGWQYVYTFRKQALIAYLAFVPAHKQRLEQMRGQPFAVTFAKRSSWPV